MDDARFGAAIRAARIRKGWRQGDLARAGGASDSTVSRVERGHLDQLGLGTIRRIAHVLDVRVELLPRSRAANLDRVVNAAHAAVAEATLRWLATIGGWVVRPEVSFSRYGERGVIDIVAWHALRRALLVIELKTAIIDVGELLGMLDRKVRNAWQVGRELGCDPVSVSSLLIVAEGSTNRRRIAAHAATFDAALPVRIGELRRWLRDPVEGVRGLAFLSDRHHGQVGQPFATKQRVSVAGARRRAAA